MGGKLTYTFWQDGYRHARKPTLPQTGGKKSLEISNKLLTFKEFIFKGNLLLLKTIQRNQKLEIALLCF